MRNIYQCKVCLETFSLLRYLRKHVTIPAAEEHQPNKCQSYYSRTAYLQENLKVNHKIVPETPTEELNCKTKEQRVQLISTSNQEKTDYSEVDDGRNMEDELAGLKFEPDEEDKLYFFDRDNPLLPDNDISSNFPQRFVNSADKTKHANPITCFLQDGKQGEKSINRVIFKRPNRQTAKIGTDVLPTNTREIDYSPGETTICKTCKLACTSLENLCIHYETLHKLPVVSFSRVITNERNPKCKRTEGRNSKEAIWRTKTPKCGICSKTFATSGSLKSHKFSIHDGKTFDCNVCQKTFLWLASLKQHKWSVHDGFRYKCNICAMKFTQIKSLNRHISSIHDNVRFKCDICQKEFKQLDTLKEHKLNLHEKMMYKCNDCPKQFQSAQSLNYHTASIHDGIRYNCELCEKKFRKEICLRDHKARIHDGVRYKCDTCPKQYSYLQTLRRHKSVEHNAK